MEITTKRIYDDPDNDGARVLVDRLWPRGVSKEEAQLDAWIKEVAPSDELRTWYDHDPDRWTEFKERYVSELKEKDDAVGRVLDVAKDDQLTLLYAATDRERNNAVVLREYLESQID
ncbi:DUF488 domain-containing protein [Natrialba aegyptia]|uniref:Uroporphyrin-III C-methyltransferase n=2 Tax=Natrialba aegyptia TaxID=129789 RepID=M0ANZ3_9EURY|nr:hypothetical protein C480_19162 [Natrialba aegyptia DSM 13077]